MRYFYIHGEHMDDLEKHSQAEASAWESEVD